MYDDILVATDGDVASENAVAHALDLAADQNATLHALYVVDSDVYSAYSGDEYVDGHEGPEQGMEEEGQDVLADVVKRAADADVDVEDAMEHGHPHEVIVEYARERDVDLVVLGTRQRPDEYRSLLGSVTEKVVRIIDGPVMVVKTPTEE